MRYICIAFVSFFLSSCAGSNKDRIVSLYNKDGVECLKVREKNLASFVANGNVPIVKLQKESRWSDVGDALLSVSIVVGKNVIQSAAQSYRTRTGVWH